VIEKEAENILRYKCLAIEIHRRWYVKNDRGDWNQLRAIHKIPKHHTGKAQIQGTAENSHIGHYTLTTGSADVEVKM
jgi:hypothetical protein